MRLRIILPPEQADLDEAREEAKALAEGKVLNLAAEKSKKPKIRPLVLRIFKLS